MDYYIHEAINAVPLAMLGGALCFLIRQVQAKRRGLSPSLSREVMMALFVCYLVGFWELVLTPNNFITDMRYTFLYHDTLYPEGFAYYAPIWEVSRWNWSLDLSNILHSREALANLLLFLPLGFSLPLLWPRLKWRGILIGFCTSLVVEILQMPIGRAFDLRDLVMNTAGAAIGAAVSLLILKRRSTDVERPQF